MKTIITENSVERIYSTDVVFSVCNNAAIDFYSVTLSLSVTGHEFKVKGVLSPDEWLKSVVHGTEFVQVGSDVTSKHTMFVENTNLDYILLTLLRILKSLNTDENTIINSISYETR